MAAVEKFTDYLLCPECGKKGVATTTEKDGAAFLRDPTTYAGEVEGFHGEDGRGVGTYARYFCDECGVEAKID